MVRLVPRGCVVAEVGTDAATVPILLLDAGGASRCVATDRSPAALAAARRRGRRHVDSRRLELRLGVGLAPLRAEDSVDVLVLCGLGARTIVGILDDPRLGRVAPRRLVLQPQTEVARVRRWLSRRGWKIVDELLARERGHDYAAIAAEPAPRGPEPEPAGEDDLELLHEAGPCLLDSSDPLVADHWRRELHRYERILSLGTTGPGHDRAVRRRDLARRVLARLSRRARQASGPGTVCYTPARSDEA